MPVRSKYLICISRTISPIESQVYSQFINENENPQMVNFAWRERRNRKKVFPFYVSFIRRRTIKEKKISKSKATRHNGAKSIAKGEEEKINSNSDKDDKQRDETVQTTDRPTDRPSVVWKRKTYSNTLFNLTHIACVSVRLSKSRCD